MKKALVAIAILGGLAALAVLTAPRLAGGFVKRQIVAQAAERGLDVRVQDVALTWTSVTLTGACLHAPEPRAGVELTCLDRARVELPLVRAARGDVDVQRIVIEEGHLNLGPELGTPDEIQALFATLAETVSGPPTTEPTPPSDPSTGTDTTPARPMPDVEIERFELLFAGQPVPLDGVTASGLRVQVGADGTDSVSATGRVAISGLRIVEVPFLSSAPDDIGFAFTFVSPTQWNLALDAPVPVVARTPASMGGVTAALSSVRVDAPHTVTVGGIQVTIAGQEIPVFEATSALLEVREFTTNVDDFYMARAELVSPRVHVDLDEDRVPTVLRAMGLVPPASEGDAEPDDGEGEEDPTDEPTPAADAEDALWADRIWWEKIPQRIDVSDGELTVRRAMDGGAETVAITGASLEYALRAIRTQADVQLRASVHHNDAPAGELSTEMTFNWATAALNLQLAVESLDLAAVGALAPALGELVPSGTVDLSLTLQEDDDGSIPTFDGTLEIADVHVASALLQAPLTLENASWEWRASMSRAGDDAHPPRALVVDHGEGTLGAARFSFRPIIYRFDYENPRLGERFDIRFSVPDQDAQTLLTSIPASLLGPVARAQMSGQWGMDINFPVTWLEPTDDGVVGIDIGESSEFEVRDSGLHLVDLPNEVDVRRLNRGTEFTFRTPTAPAGRVINIPPPRETVEGDPDAEAGGPGGDWARLQQISYFVTAATLYREDGRFFRNRGINWFQWRAVLEEAWQEGALGRGASTISMQLVKNVFLSHERTVERKLQELFLTYWMTRLVPKERILEVYLNVIEWGDGINGIVEASRHYFGTSSSDLTVEQSAWLSSIVPAPVRRGRQRSQGVAADWSARECADVMTGMESRGWITASELAKGLSAEIRFVTAGAREPLPAVQPFDPLAGMSDLRVAPTETDGAERGPLNNDPQERIRALIAGSIPLRP